jgi:hypothetical protein
LRDRGAEEDVNLLMDGAGPLVIGKRLARARGVPVPGWTANEPAAVRRLDGRGVDAVVSDDPEMALGTLLAP